MSMLMKKYYFDNCACEENLIITQVSAPYYVINLNHYTNSFISIPLTVYITVTDGNSSLNTTSCSFNIETEYFHSIDIL